MSGSGSFMKFTVRSTRACAEVFTQDIGEC